MSLIETALGIALDAHRGQTDKAGAPYITHPLRMMMRMESETLQAAAARRAGRTTRRTTCGRRVFLRTSSRS